MAESVIVSPFGCKLPVGFPVGLRVLAVDGDAVGLEELKFMLHLCGFYVTGKKTAEEAVEEVRRSEEGFDIVMTEVHMPGMGGFELLRRVKNRLPVIMFSDDEGVATVMRSVVGGACDYLVKPLRTEMIRGIWQHVLRRKLNIIAAAAAPERRTSSLPNDPVAAAAAATALAMSSHGGDGQVAAAAGGSLTDGQFAAVAGSSSRGDGQVAAAAAAVGGISIPGDGQAATVEGSSRGNRGALEAVWAAATKMAAEMSADSSNYMLPAQGKGRKGRFNWTPEVHALFVKAVNMLKDRAAPKKIKQLLALEGIYVTKAQVSSHLQKYRIWCNDKPNQTADLPLRNSDRYRSPWKPLNSTFLGPTTHMNYMGFQESGTSFFTNIRPQRTTIDYESLIKQASLRSDATSVGRDAHVNGRQAIRETTSTHGGFVPNECLVSAMQSKGTSTSHGAAVTNKNHLVNAPPPSNLTQPMQTSHIAGFPTNFNAINDPRPVSQEMSVPQTTQLEHGNDAMLNCSLEIDDLGDDMLMDNLFDVAELYGTQEMLDPDATFEFSPMQPEDRNSDFPSLGSTDGLTDTSVEALTEGMLNDPLLQDELENSE